MELVELKTVSDSYRQLALAAGVFLQDPQWGDFQESIGNTIRRFAVHGEHGEVLMFAQTIARAVGGKVFLFAPHGPVFAVYVSGTERNNVFDFFLENLPTVSGGVMFFRFEPEHPIGSGLLKSKIKKTIDLNPHQTLILNLGQSVEELLAEMKPKTRYNIRLAEKSGVEVRVLQELPIPAVGGDDPIAASAKRAGIRAYSHAYFNDLLKFFNEHPGPIQARCYAAYHEGDLLAANIMLEYGETAIYLFGGSLELKRNLMPSYALHFQAIQDAKSRGCKHYDFWGVETDENHPWYGFSKFKLGFGGRIIERPGTLDFVYNSAWYNAYGIVRKLNRLKNLRFRN